MTYLVAFVLMATCYAREVPKRSLSVVDAIQTTRAMISRDAFGSLRAIQKSPDGQRYAVALIRGDIDCDCVLMQIVVGELSSLEAARPRVVAHLSTRGLGADPTGQAYSSWLTAPTNNAPRWLDNEHIAFYWEDSRMVRQAVSVNIRTSELRFLTSHSTDVANFDVHNRVVVYGALLGYSPDRSDSLMRRGFAVNSPDAFGLLSGVVDERSVFDLNRDSYERFIRAPADLVPRKVRVSGGGVNRDQAFMSVEFSPDGRFGIMEGTPSIVPDEWHKYRDDFFGAIWKEMRASPAGGYARQLKQLFVLDVQEATARPLWNVPMAWGSQPKAIVWSPDGRTVLLAPSLVPRENGGFADQAVVEVDARSGRHWILPIERAVVAELTAMDWITPDSIEIQQLNAAPLLLRKREGVWKQVTVGTVLTEPMKQSLVEAAIDVELRQDMNKPPALYGTDSSTGREVVLWDLNPQLTHLFSLGKVQLISWKDPAGPMHSGRLYYPAKYDPRRRYPLVIQTHGYAPQTEYSIYGQGGASGIALGPGWSVYLAQVLAGDDIAVLQLGGPTNGYPGLRQPADSLAIVKNQVAGYEAAIEKLVAMGLVDRERIGLMGHSGTGWNVEYALTHSGFPYAAAIAADHKNGGYIQAALSGWMFGLSEELNGAAPFGTGLQAWLVNSPAMNAHRVETPLQLQVTDSTGGVGSTIKAWEMFSRLRYLGKPVELYVVPNILRGSHLLQNPGQLLGVQERARDWWRFWLKGDEDCDPTKSTQYAHWRQLRTLQRGRTIDEPCCAS